ncbi:hypothetical protein DFH08DRAFT_815570 [Mycena albidolilacea]|uniref:Uncharacterized protein n=1 Tax=Mycena albidolilacea TaxID=1033008 RepID=A0AAD6ZLZ7_9AGAR|nr:hypothetical protein DFH08DRAFT_815570 [Mycena albidolilacea]
MSEARDKPQPSPQLHEGVSSFAENQRLKRRRLLQTDGENAGRHSVQRNNECFQGGRGQIRKNFVSIESEEAVYSTSFSNRQATQTRKKSISTESWSRLVADLDLDFVSDRKCESEKGKLWLVVIDRLIRLEFLTHEKRNCPKQKGDRKSSAEFILVGRLHFTFDEILTAISPPRCQYASTMPEFSTKVRLWKLDRGDATKYSHK